jgi:hypothetical protein
MKLNVEGMSFPRFLRYKTQYDKAIMKARQGKTAPETLFSMFRLKAGRALRRRKPLNVRKH